MNTTSATWALAFLKEEGYTITRTSYGYIIRRPWFSYVAGTIQDLINFANEEEKNVSRD